MFRTSTVVKCIVFLCCCWSLASCSEDTVEPEIYGSISGVVVESGTNAVIEGVSITTTPATSAIATDNAGRFIIETIPVGNYNITAKKSGWRTEAVSVLVSKDKVADVRIIMEKNNLQNSAPLVPTLPSPANEATNQPVSVRLTWKGTDPDKNDSLRYDVELYESGMINRRLIGNNTPDTTLLVENLRYNTVYFWQVTARDLDGAETKSPLWSFRTAELPEFRYLFVRKQGSNYDLFASDSANTLRLTNTSFNELQPLLNPFRDKVAFSSNETGKTHIYTMERDGTGSRRVTTIPIAGYHNEGIGFAWSPDGSQIIYANYDNLYVVNRDGTGLRLIAKAPANRHFRQLDWTAYGNKIVAQTIGSNIYDSEIYLMQADGSNMKLLVGNQPGRIESPMFSLDGSEVLFTRDVSGLNAADGRQLNSHIFIMKADSSGLTDISASKPAGTNDLHPRFSPDGARIIFVNASNDNVGPKDIWIMDANGQNRRRLFQNAELPDWK